MLKKPDPPRHVLLRRERNRRSVQRRREGKRIWPVELPNTALEGIVDALVYFGRLSESETCDQRRIAEELARQLVWFAEHWRELRR